jgi:hypothetical protein
MYRYGDSEGSSFLKKCCVPTSMRTKAHTVIHGHVTVCKNVLTTAGAYWMTLCQQAAVEQDPERLMHLIGEINRMLDAKDNRLKRQQI